MKAYFVSNVGATKEINWKNMICISKCKDTCIGFRDQFYPEGLVLEIEMDDEDVLNAVTSCMLGNSCVVKYDMINIVA